MWWGNDFHNNPDSESKKHINTHNVGSPVKSPPVERLSDVMFSHRLRSLVGDLERGGSLRFYQHLQRKSANTPSLFTSCTALFNSKRLCLLNEIKLHSMGYIINIHYICLNGLLPLVSRVTADEDVIENEDGWWEAGSSELCECGSVEQQVEFSHLLLCCVNEWQM